MLKRKKGTYCVYCNCDNPLALTKDHITPKSQGGSDDPKNIQTLCWVCNQIKGSLTHEQFMEYMKALKILKTLTKIRIDFPARLPMVFSPHHYPQFEYKRPEEEKKNGN